MRKIRPKASDLSGLLNMGTAFQVSQVVWEALRMGIFDALEARPCALRSLAGRLEVSPQGLSRLMRVLQALGLVAQDGPRLRNTPIASACLCRGSACYIGDFFLHLETLQEQWRCLGRAVRDNGMIQPGARRSARYARQLRLFLQAMHAVGVVKSGCIRQMFSLAVCRSMLDIGGGLGTYAVGFARDNPGLQATVFDLKTVVPHTRAYIKSCGVQGRVRAVAGECLHDPIPPGPYDLVLVSNLLHIYGRRDCRKIINRAVRVLSGGGTLLIHDYVFGSSDDLAVALFDMTMLAGTPEGRCPEMNDLKKWMSSAAICGIKTAVVPGGTSIVWGRKG